MLIVNQYIFSNVNMLILEKILTYYCYNINFLGINTVYFMTENLIYKADIQNEKGRQI